MDSPPDEHADLISKCLIHVAYLGRGLFVALVKHEKPLEVIKSVNGACSYVVGELTIIEQKTFDKTLRTGLGVGINMEDVPVNLSMPHTKLTEDKTLESTPVDLSTTLHHSNKKVETQLSSLARDSTQFSEPSTSSAMCKISLKVTVNKYEIIMRPSTSPSGMQNKMSCLSDPSPSHPLAWLPVLSVFSTLLSFSSSPWCLCLN